MRSGDLHKVFRGGSSDFFNLIAHLSILFEDLRIENAGVLAPDDSLGDMDTIGRNYRKLYFVRRSLVTLSEVARCVKAIAANSEFREQKVSSRALYLRDVDEANSYFSKKIDLINQFRTKSEVISTRRPSRELLPFWQSALLELSVARRHRSAISPCRITMRPRFFKLPF